MLTGLDYDPDRPAIEVMTRAFQMLFHPLAGKDGIDIDLDKLVRDDPEMLDLALGLCKTRSNIGPQKRLHIAVVAE